MKEIQLTQGYVALVDDEDYERVSQFKWFADLDKNEVVYAKRQVRLHKRTNSKYRAQRLHRFILGVTDPKINVDHKDHNGLNCQKENLRRCTSQQNSWNSRKSARKRTSKYKGVSKHTFGKWVANIMDNKKLRYLGIFSQEIDAAKAYDAAAQQVFGEFALLNFKDNS